ncbi:MAG: LamG domain-containing protein [Cyanobacteria bacterium J06643_4]
MLLPLQQLKHANAITHEGKLLLFATDNSGKIWYSVKQDGFEDNALEQTTQIKGWENWQTLELPADENPDQSVLEKEKAELTRQDDDDRYLLRSRYYTIGESAIAPVQLISGMGHLYVFRQSAPETSRVAPSTLLVDRFVLDGITNKLVRKLEVRYKRSRQKYAPLQPKEPGSGQTIVDSLDFRDTNNKPFFEPTTELSLIDGLKQGWFSVVLLPTNEQGRYRWHIFAYNTASQQIELTSIRASEEGLFDLKDETVLEPLPQAPEVIRPRRIPGIIQRQLVLQTDDNKPLTVANGFGATKYDLQIERETSVGPRLLRENTRVLLSVPTAEDNTVALSFAVGLDGTLSQVDETGEQTLLRDRSHDVLLPLNTLDDIRPIGAVKPPQGKITAMRRGQEDYVTLHSERNNLNSGDLIRIHNTMDYNGYFQISDVQADSFTIQSSFAGEQLGAWELVPPAEAGVMFDGMITRFEAKKDGSLVVNALNHGLEQGDAVQVIDTTAVQGLFAVTKLNQHRFQINHKWQQGQAVNLRLLSKRRRGLRFDGQKDAVETPALALTPPLSVIDFGQTYSAWIWRAAPSAENSQTIIGHKNGTVQLAINDDRATLRIQTSQGLDTVVSDDVLPTQAWIHLAMTIEHSADSRASTLVLYRDGIETARHQIEDTALDFSGWDAQCVIGQGFDGKIADVRIWDKARKVKAIKDSMYLQLTGREVGLVGYYRLGAIAQNQAIDFSVFGKDAAVKGSPYVSAVTLSRTLSDQATPAIQYANAELFAVTQRATYLESFEFRADNVADPNSVDENGTPIFAITTWGKRSRRSEERTDFAAEPTQFESLGDGWFRASARFTIPDNVNLARDFELSRVAGEWRTLEVRKHSMRQISDAITQATYQDTLSLKLLANSYATIYDDLRELEKKEKEEAALLLEKRSLEIDIKHLENILQNGAITNQRELEKQQQLLSELEQAVQQYNSKLNSPDNYWYTYHPVGRPDHVLTSGLLYGGRYDQTEFLAVMDPKAEQLNRRGYGHNGRDVQKNHLWRIDPTTSMLLNPAIGFSRPSGYVVRGMPGEALLSRPHSDNGLALKNHQWKEISVGNGAYQIVETTSNLPMVALIIDDHPYYSDASPNTTALLGAFVSGAVILGVPERGSLALLDSTIWSMFLDPNKQSYNQWTRKQHSLAIDIGEDKTAERNRVSAIVEQLKRFEQGDIQKTLQQRRDRLETVIGLLVTLQLEIAQLNTKILQALRDINHQPQVMPELHSDQRNLRTTGARLGFAQAKSRIQALETSEGNVQLSYFDTEGLMRQTNFDVTADSQNATFEQWRPDGVRASLDLSNQGFIVFQTTQQTESGTERVVKTPVALGEAWSIEAWFSWPLPKIAGEVDHLLVSASDESAPLAVREIAQVGQSQFILGSIDPQGGFSPSGYDLMTHLKNGWHHIAAVGKGTGEEATTTFFINGEQVAQLNINKALSFAAIGNHPDGKKPFGRLAEVRAWQVALSTDEIAINSKVRLTGNEPGLMGYWPLSEAEGTEIRNHAGNGANGQAFNARWCACPALIGRLNRSDLALDAIVSAEYSTLTIDPVSKRKTAMMRRFFAVPAPNGLEIFPDQRIEELELQWVGNTQFQPTLLGYIEGAPPVPSENLTVDGSLDYNGATSVALTSSDEVTYSWNREQEAGLGANLDLFVGVEEDIRIGFIASKKAFSAKAGFVGSLGFNYNFLNSSTVSASSQTETQNRLDLRGAPEPGNKFPHIGRRFIPKNVGYALVTSGLADIYITRLKRSGKMIGYQVRPNEDIPIDVNTITFLINPAYTMNGSLDGQTGTSATSDRFFRHVPEMRSQYGALYPASYYRIQEAYDLKTQIENDDKQRESYFVNFNSRLVDEASLNREIDNPEFERSNIVLPTAGNTTDGQEGPSNQAKIEQIDANLTEDSDQLQRDGKARQKEIEERVENEEQRVQASAALSGWQRKMETLQARAGKRNIANTYVWDGDGGWRAETQQFMNSIEHTVGASLNFNASLGGTFGTTILIAGLELTAAATIELTQTLTKSESRSRGFGLDIDMSGVEHVGITDFNDNPLLPGEKVDRYRFTSFYLEGSNQNFDDFFNHVVDPEWLASNDEEARSLRQTRSGKSNKAWRVLHRVTYVERPALTGFGHDVRPQVDVEERPWWYPSVGGVLERVESLQKHNDELEAKLDQVLKLLRQSPKKEEI